MFAVRQVFVSSSYLTVLLFIKCGEPFKEEDMIVINGTKEEVETLKDKMLERREKAKSKVCLTSELCFWFIQSPLRNKCSVSEIQEEQSSQSGVGCVRSKRCVCEASLTTVTLSYYTNLFSISINSVRPPEHLLCPLDVFEYTEVSCSSAQASGAIPEAPTRGWEMVLICV